jgi:hypothetical protein
MAVELGLTVDELREHFADAIRPGPERVIARLTEALYQAAMRGNASAMRLLLQLRAEGQL